MVAPPSVAERGEWAWLAGYGPHELPVALAPDWLRELMRPRAAGTAAPASEWRNLVSRGVGEGERNQAVARLTGHLLRRYVDPWVVLDLMRLWNAARCSPPLEDNEVVGIVNSIAAAEARRRAT